MKNPVSFIVGIVFFLLFGSQTPNTVLAAEPRTVDNILILIRHGRNFELAPWNIRNGSEDLICKNTEIFFRNIQRKYTNLNNGDLDIHLLVPEYEKDLDPGVISTTNRFFRTAVAIKVGYEEALQAEAIAQGSSSRKVNLVPFEIPGATSASNFSNWYCNGAGKFEGCDRDQHTKQQRQRITDFKNMLDRDADPLNVAVISRSFGLDLVDLYAWDKGADEENALKKSLKEEFHSLKREEFYDQYWVIERSGSTWVGVASKSFSPNLNTRTCGQMRVLAECAAFRGQRQNKLKNGSLRCELPIYSAFARKFAGTTVGHPRTKILDRDGYKRPICLRECFDNTHGKCVAATFHHNTTCKLFSSYTGIVKSVVRNKRTYIRRLE